MNNYLADH